MCQENHEHNQEASKEQIQEEAQAKEQSPKTGKLVWFLLLAIVLAVFGAIVLFTDFLGNQFGETAENIVLAVIALILAGLLYLTHKQQ